MKQAQVPDAHTLCIECREGITNPICPACLAREMESWEPTIKSIILSADDTNDYGEADWAKCVFCGMGMNICAHCYCKDVYESLLETDPKIAEKFIETFDFGLREEFI